MSPKAAGAPVTSHYRGWEDEEAWERWRTWVKAVEARQSVKNTMSEKKNYLSIYKICGGSRSERAGEGDEEETRRALRGGNFGDNFH